MTACVAIKVHDCLVFAADSAVTLRSPTSFNVYNHGYKVFNLYKGLPIVAMTAGMGNFGAASISTLAKDFRITLTRGSAAECIDRRNYTMKEVATKARCFFSKKYGEIDPPPSGAHSFEFWIGGYGSNELLGEIWKLEIRDGIVMDIDQIASAATENKICWGGQVNVISRILLGIDPNIFHDLQNIGIAESDLQTIRDRNQTPLLESSMPVQDAVDLADFLVYAAKRYSAFLPGAAVVGGETDIATVTRHEGFKWIQRKHFYHSHLNPMETDHVS